MNYFLPLLTILLIGLKLGGVIDWAWVWVMAPLIAGFTLWILVLIIALLATMIMVANRHNLKVTKRR